MELLETMPIQAIELTSCPFLVKYKWTTGETNEMAVGGPTVLAPMLTQLAQTLNHKLSRSLGFC